MSQLSEATQSHNVTTVSSSQNSMFGYSGKGIMYSNNSKLCFLLFINTQILNSFSIINCVNLFNLNFVICSMC